MRGVEVYFVHVLEKLGSRKLQRTLLLFRTVLSELLLCRRSAMKVLVLLLSSHCAQARGLCAEAFGISVECVYRMVYNMLVFSALHLVRSGMSFFLRSCNL